MRERGLRACASSVAVAAAVGLSGCDGSPTYRSWDDVWFKSPNDTLLDGAVRVSTSTHKDGRSLTLRCFRHRPDDPGARLDLRYTLEMPLLKQVATELSKAGGIELVVTVDGTPTSILKADAVAHDFGMSFLGPIEREAVVHRIGEAKKSIVVMPRRGGDRLDKVVEFGTQELATHIQPVKRACGALQPNPPPQPQAETKKT
jgi:hypothetical protein